MKYYLIEENSELTIVKVQAQDEAEFLEHCPGKILTCGSSIQEVILAFSLMVQQRSRQ